MIAPVLVSVLLDETGHQPGIPQSRLGVSGIRESVELLIVNIPTVEDWVNNVHLHIQKHQIFKDSPCHLPEVIQKSWRFALFGRCLGTFLPDKPFSPAFGSGGGGWALFLDSEKADVNASFSTEASLDSNSVSSLSSGVTDSRSSSNVLGFVAFFENSKVDKDDPAHPGNPGVFPLWEFKRGAEDALAEEDVEPTSSGLFTPALVLLGVDTSGDAALSSGSSPSSPLLMERKISLAGTPASRSLAISNLADQAPTAITPVVFPSLTGPDPPPLE